MKMCLRESKSSIIHKKYYPKGGTATSLMIQLTSVGLYTKLVEHKQNLREFLIFDTVSYCLMRSPAYLG